jgi:hypothetical protein
MPTIGGKSFADRSDGSGTPIYQRTGGASGGGGNLLVGHFKCRDIYPSNPNGGTTNAGWNTYAVGIEVDPNKNYKLLNLMNFGMGGMTLSGASYTYKHAHLEMVQIGATIPTVDDGFLLDHFTPVARLSTANVYAFIKNNTTGKVYGEDTILAGTTQNPAQKTVYNVSNTSILWIGAENIYNSTPETDMIGLFEVS